MYNRKYEKIMFILRPEAGGTERRNASGSCTIEIKNGKGKLVLYAQGLHNQSKPYRVYLISADLKRTWGIDAGVLETDLKGKGKLKWEFDPDDVAGSKLAIEKFNTVAVAKKDKDTHQIDAPLAGYQGQKTQWKDNFVEFTKEYCKEVERELEEEAKAAEKEKTEQPQKTETAYLESDEKPNETEAREDEIKEESIEAAVQAEEEQMKTEESEPAMIYATAKDFYEDFRMQEGEGTAASTFKTITKRFHEELTKLEEQGVLSKEEMAYINGDKTEQKLRGIDYCFANNEKITPFFDRSNEWIRISSDELWLLPIKNCKLPKHPFVLCGEKKYRHLLLGKDVSRGEGTYLLGVPDEYAAKNSMKAASLGFKRFDCCQDAEIKEGGYGYWIMDISC